MKIAFVTTQSSIQSTVIGRVFPLAQEFQKMGHEVVVFLHSETPASSTQGVGALTPGVFPAGVTMRITGTNPFQRTEGGKKRQIGLRLLMTIKLNALRAAWGLIMERPDYIILVKPLPENTLAVSIAKLFLWKTKIILDVDDFELFANNLSSLGQRAAIHLSERVATGLASRIVVATPFLYDHIHQMVAGKKEIMLIPTGLTAVAPQDGGAKAGFVPSNSNAHTILYIGSVSVSSGHRVDLLPEILQEVRKQVPNASLLFAGSGDNESELKKGFQELQLEHAVKFLGRFSLERISDVTEQAAVLIDPIDASIVNRAKSSFRCALALVTAMPIVTSNIGIRTELLPAQLHVKFFATPADVSSYAAHIIDILQSPLSETEKAAMLERSNNIPGNILQ